MKNYKDKIDLQLIVEFGELTSELLNRGLLDDEQLQNAADIYRAAINKNIDNQINSAVPKQYLERLNITKKKSNLKN